MTINEISEKYPLVYKRILSYTPNRSTVKLSSAFFWDTTKEGIDFWSNLDRRNIHLAMSLQPHLFDLSKNIVVNKKLW